MAKPGLNMKMIPKNAFVTKQQANVITDKHPSDSTGSIQVACTNSSSRNTVDQFMEPIYDFRPALCNNSTSQGNLNAIQALRYSSGESGTGMNEIVAKIGTDRLLSLPPLVHLQSIHLDGHMQFNPVCMAFLLGAASATLLGASSKQTDSRKPSFQ